MVRFTFPGHVSVVLKASSLRSYLGIGIRAQHIKIFSDGQCTIATSWFHLIWCSCSLLVSWLWCLHWAFPNVICQHLLLNFMVLWYHILYMNDNTFLLSNENPSETTTTEICSSVKCFVEFTFYCTHWFAVNFGLVDSTLEIWLHSQTSLPHA